MLTVDDHGGDERTRIVAASGELDYATGDYFVGRTEGVGPQLILDLTGLTFIDSTGIAKLIRLSRSFETDDRRLVIVVPSGGQVRRILEVRGLVEKLPLSESLEAAHQRLAEPS
jgi:anti-sigma B factor antagonist